MGRLNRFQRWVVIIYFVLITCASLWVPWQGAQMVGDFPIHICVYAWLWRVRATGDLLDYRRILLQYIAISAACLAVFLIAGEFKRKPALRG